MKMLVRSANKLKIPVEEYRAQIEAGNKWCFACQLWHPRSEFGSNKAQKDGLTKQCLASMRVKGEKLWQKFEHPRGMAGKKHSLESRQKMTGARKGQNNGRWKGGVTPANRLARTCANYYEWRKSVFERDGYCCQKCLNSKRKDLRAHHIQPFATYPKLRYEVTNGLTLCKQCHDDLHRS